MTIHRSSRPLRTLLAGVAAAAGLIVGAGHAEALRTPTSAPTDLSPAARAVVALTEHDGQGTVTQVPADFTDVMGYRPILVDGRAVNPTGGCSSPIRLPRRFESLCREHDLGYDLLRYADRTGRPLGAWARLDLDRMLIDAMTESCDDPVCRSTAQVARIGLALNTWRQFDGPPTHAETVPDIVGSLAARSWTLMTRTTPGAQR